MIAGVLGIRAVTIAVTVRSPTRNSTTPGRRPARLRQLDAAYTAWNDGARTLDTAGLSRPCGPDEGAFAHYPVATLVLHINRETIHHGAEIILLRDLYRHST